MINPELYTVIKDYIPKSDVFYHEKNKIIWKKIVELNKNKSPIDPISIVSKLSSKEKQAVSAYYITGLPDSIPSTANVEHHAQVILERFLKRELIKSSIKIQKGAYENNEEFEKLIKKVKKTTDSLTALSHIKDPSIESIIDETLD